MEPHQYRAALHETLGRWSVLMLGMAFLALAINAQLSNDARLSPMQAWLVGASMVTVVGMVKFLMSSPDRPMKSWPRRVLSNSVCVLCGGSIDTLFTITWLDRGLAMACFGGIIGPLLIAMMSLRRG